MRVLKTMNFRDAIWFFSENIRKFSFAIRNYIMLLFGSSPQTKFFLKTMLINENLNKSAFFKKKNIAVYLPKLFLIKIIFKKKNIYIKTNF